MCIQEHMPKCLEAYCTFYLYFVPMDLGINRIYPGKNIYLLLSFCKKKLIIIIIIMSLTLFLFYLILLIIQLINLMSNFLPKSLCITLPIIIITISTQFIFILTHNLDLIKLHCLRTCHKTCLIGLGLSLQSFFKGKGVAIWQN